MTLTVGFAKNGSRRAVVGSGTAIMSDSWMPIQPRIDEPSNPRPSSKVSSSSVSTGNEQCCQLPSMSTNFRSTISAWFFLAYVKNSFAFLGKSSGVIGAPCVLRAGPGAPGRALACDVTERGNAFREWPAYDWHRSPRRGSISQSERGPLAFGTAPSLVRENGQSGTLVQRGSNTCSLANRCSEHR